MRTIQIAVALCLLTGLSLAQPHTREAEEAALAKVAAKIQLYCENKALQIKIDWKAFDALDYQVLIAGEQAEIAKDPALVARIKKYILTGDDEDKGTILMTGTVTGGGGTAAVAFESICRDQPALRPAAAKITTIVLEPIADQKFLADHDKIAFARRTNDWTAVHKAHYETTRDMDESFRELRPRFAISGSTLTITQNVMGRMGDDSDLTRWLADALGGKAEDKKPEAKADAPRPAKRDLGKQLDCEKDYRDVDRWSDDRDYPVGTMTSTTFSAEPTTIYKCVGRSGCKKDDSLLGQKWKLVGHC